MELRHLRYFVAVAEEGSFLGGAERLHLAQPALSRQIRDLEEDLGVTLLQRGPRGVRLTDAGTVFLERTRLLLGEVAGAAREAQRAARGQVGTLRIGVAEPITYGDLLPRLFSTFRAHRPHVDLEIVALNEPQQIEQLRTRHIDVGFLFQPAVADPSLAAERLRQDVAVVVLPKDHRLSRERAITLRLLNGEPWIGWSRELMPLVYDGLFAACLQRGLRIDHVHRAPNLHTKVAMVAAGMGWTFAWASVARVRWPGVVMLPARGLRFTMDTYALWRKDSRSVLVEALLSLARGTLAVGRRPA